MPGGRLSPAERQKIATGVADGLAYAEIARRLGRPTSTITREVLRNGGPHAYRAEAAQRATAHRAHRRRAAVAGTGRAPATRVHGRDPDAVRAYEQRLTELFVQSGLTSMGARVLTCLYTTDDGTLTAGELVQRLGVSPASVSKAVAHLESQGLVRRERDGRRERYVFDADVWYQSMIASARANALLAETTREGVAILGAATPAGVRLENIARFVAFVGESIERAAEQAREILHTR
ncbi:MarR family transcriptional regulator [Xylanimonas sp. McL0601]|uniref:GbsR/MarR family transcriptional regulator n=1 Tax=Xylanimonas sp. McL0601 TaxID=3414739 RepID=UPI003CEC9A72